MHSACDRFLHDVSKWISRWLNADAWTKWCVAITEATAIAAVVMLTFGVSSSPAGPPGMSPQVNGRAEQRDWPVYGGSRENDHYSDLAQINRSNVKQLTVAWTFDTEGGPDFSIYG